MKPLTLFLLSVILFSFTLIDGNWVIIKSEKEGYEISFPKQPEEQSQNVSSAVGELKMNMMIYEAEENSKDKNLVYLFNYTDYPEGKLDYNDSSLVAGTLEGAVNGGANKVKGKLLSNEIVIYKNYPGRHARIDYNEGQAVIVMYCYMVRNRIYLLETIALTEHDNNADQQKFLNSFNLLN